MRTDSPTELLSRPIPQSTDLRETGSLQRRWMSLPNSRIVVNPYDFYSPLSPAQYSGGPNFPLNFGYYSDGEASDLPERLMLYRKLPGIEGALDIEWQDEFDQAPLHWEVEQGLKAEIRQGRVDLTVTGKVKQWGSIDRWIEVDLDKHPYIQVKVSEARGHWALKINDGSEGSSDIVLQGDIHRTGEFTYPIPQATGWSGKKRILIKLFAVWQDSPISIDCVRILGLKEIHRPADRFETSWTPHELEFSCEYTPGVRVRGIDFFYDVDTVIRSLRFNGTEENQSVFTLAGRYRGTPSWDPDRSVLVIETPTYCYAIGFSGVGANDASYFSSDVEFLAGLYTDQEALSEGIWSIDFSPREGRNVVLSIGFATAKQGRSVAVRRALHPLQNDHWRQGRLARQAFWDDYLESVPHPGCFSLQQVPDHGVTPEAIRRNYYTAWIFLAANILPVMPETGFAYPQFPAGKPSLWGEGHPLARPSASWESFFAMQLYSYVDPELAAQAYRGIMSLVDEKGLLGGESLPSRKAQTGLMLYEMTGDLSILKDTYSALKRYLLWRRDNPRWIHKSHDFSDEKDADFVVSAIIDMEYARRIANRLGMPEEEHFWSREKEALFKNYLSWFWSSPSSEPVQIFFTGSGKTGWGNTLWVSTGLHLDLLEGEQLAGLVRRFHRDFDPAGTFCGFFVPKYPEIGFTVYGLLEHGLSTEAAIFANATVRDVVRANLFAEQYQVRDFPYPDGVRPSLFGVAALIDMLWMKNGYRMDQGSPWLVRLPGERGGLSNLRIRGKELEVLLKPDTGSTRLSGEYIKAFFDKGLVDLPLPEGSTLALPGLQNAKETREDE